MEEGILFQKMVFASVAGDFEFWAQPIPRPFFFGDLNRCGDSLQVPLKIEGPLIEIACG
jgi:hypothetical protein